ncbi:response regulator [Mesorhizobium sp. B2-4-9]|uniref:response regulator n=1 Tax=Mesorhizobium sp. B2-4-9 TaxID=2589940 RepID=UPI00112698C0|nr:response regulator [Mesorhizobium sp. B2-4-9]TPL21092.1 response regulator [Mesorhizobium sp. B2-4-9]
MELQGTRVFLVEDDDLVAMSVEDMLADLGCTVAAQARSVPEALEKARAEEFEVALLDVSLHGNKVFPVAEFLSDQGIPFAFASGYGRAGLPQAFRTRPVVPKPFELAELSAALTAALSGGKGGSWSSAELHEQ